MKWFQDACTHNLGLWSYDYYPAGYLLMWWQLPGFQVSHHKRVHAPPDHLHKMEEVVLFYRTVMIAVYIPEGHCASFGQNPDHDFHSNKLFC